MQVYIAVSYNKRSQLQAELNAIKEAALEHFFKPFIFIDNYNFNSLQSKEMMQE